MDWKQFITANPAIHHGMACIKDTRIPVAIVLDNLAAGLAIEEIVKSYPSLSVKAIQAAITYAAELAREESILLPA